MTTTLFFSIWIPCIIIGTVIGHKKGNTVAGVVLTAALGLIGLFIVLIMPTTEAKKIANEAERQRIEDAAREQRRAAPGAPPRM
jgi:ABC-type transport system involved in cytochrome bd biosynthesis fused ATPase/permease subunit